MAPPDDFPEEEQPDESLPVDPQAADNTDVQPGSEEGDEYDVAFKGKHLPQPHIGIQHSIKSYGRAQQPGVTVPAQQPGQGAQPTPPALAGQPAGGGTPTSPQLAAVDQSVPLDQWVQNQYGEKVRERAPGEQGANIFNAQGAELSQQGVPGKPQPVPLEKGIEQMIRERADRAIPPIPPGNYTQAQHAALQLERFQKVSALSSAQVGHEQRRRAASEAALTRAAFAQHAEESKLRRDALLDAQKARQDEEKHQNDLERDREKADLQKHELTMNKKSDVLMKMHGNLDKEYKDAIEKKIPEKDRPAWMATEFSRRQHAMELADEHMAYLGMPGNKKATDKGAEPAASYQGTPEERALIGSATKMDQMTAPALKRPDFTPEERAMDSLITPERAREIKEPLKQGVLAASKGSAMPAKNLHAALHKMYTIVDSADKGNRNLTVGEHEDYQKAHAEVEKLLKEHGGAAKVALVPPGGLKPAQPVQAGLPAKVAKAAPQPEENHPDSWWNRIRGSYHQPKDVNQEHLGGLDWAAQHATSPDHAAKIRDAMKLYMDYGHAGVRKLTPANKKVYEEGLELAKQNGFKE